MADNGIELRRTGSTALALYSTEWAQELVARGANELDELHDADYYFDKGYDAQREKRYGDAVHWYEKALSVESEHEAALYWKGYCYLPRPCHLGYCDRLYGMDERRCARQAQGCFEKLAELVERDGQPGKRDSTTYHMLALSYSVQGEKAVAEEKYRETLRLDPKACLTWHNLGVVIDAQKRYAEAEECYRKAIECNPDKSLPYYSLGCVRDDAGDGQEALRLYRRYLELVDREDPWEKATIDYVVTRADQLKQELLG